MLGEEETKTNAAGWWSGEKKLNVILILSLPSFLHLSLSLSLLSVYIYILVFSSFMLWGWHFAFMCVTIYSCLHLLQFFTTFYLRHFHLLLIADGIERNIITWFSSSQVCLISSTWHSMHLLHGCTVIFDTNDGLLLLISFQYSYIEYVTKLYVPYFLSLEISEHTYNSASTILILKQYKCWLLYSPFLLGCLMCQF